MHWIILVIGGFFEVGFTTCLKFSDNFTKLWWSIGFLITSTLSFVFLNWAMKAIPLGTAYAVWTGMGAVGVASQAMRSPARSCLRLGTWR